MKGIQVCLDKETNPHQKGDNLKNANMYRAGSFKNLVLKNQ
jgi:hypothetical protein